MQISNLEFGNQLVCILTVGKAHDSFARVRVEHHVTIILGADFQHGFCSGGEWRQAPLRAPECSGGVS